jgi:Fe-S-cluster containining protein
MIDKVPALAEYDNGQGVCIHLSGKLCDIYDTRPDICNVNTMYLLFYKDKMSEEEFIKMNIDACAELKKLHNIA